MKKFLAVIVTVAMCITPFSFTSHPLETTAQTVVNENNISVMNSNVKPAVESVNLETKDVQGLEEKDVTDYYKSNPDAISKLLSTEKANVAMGGTAWGKTYGGSNYDKASSIQQTTDGGYIVPYSLFWCRQLGFPCYKS